MKLGGSICSAHQSPEEWGALLKASRFAAVPCPVNHTASREVARGYFEEAQRLNVTVAEIGVWKNPLSPNGDERRAALDFAKAQLAFGEEMGVPCCVNIVGSRGEIWDGAYPDNYSADTYDAIVLSVREIIDAVKPSRCHYSIEPMPWMVPDGPDEYLQLCKDVDRPMFGVHLDFVNMINSPRRYLFAGAFVEECLTKLGPRILSCHIKDVLLERPFTTILREVAPGQGGLDFARILRALHTHLPTCMPVLLEHMHTDEEFAAAYSHLEGIAAQAGIPIR